MSKERVVVAMSGGVDSSLAAALLKKDGYDVIGATMQLRPADELAGEQMESARRVAHKLGIPHHAVNFGDVFGRHVINYFCQEYSLGRTPNPCIRCNQYIKFDALLKRAKELGAHFLATGHYARIEHSGDGYRLLKGVDRIKDQSYFLYTLGQNVLQSLILPIGNLHKEKVRRMVAELDLPTTRNESQDICFIPDNDYRSFIARHVPLKPGEIIDTEGNLLGKHHGLAQYTVGQRQGLGLSSNTRLYVLKLDAANNRLIVGTEDQLFTSTLFATDLSWVSGEAPTDTTSMTAKVRYKSPEVPLTLYLNDGVARVDFHQPQRAISPGQSVVFYQGDAVLGGGVIEDRVD